jgi:hypothetical protein
MESTYSNLKIQLMGTGENSGTWGTITNINLGTALEEAITGSADVTFSSGTVTLTLSDTNSSQTARNLRLNLTGTSGGAQNLIVPAIEKAYLINNGCADAITVKNASGTGIAVPAGKTMWVYNNGTNVVDAITHLTSLTLGAPLPITSGGTGGNTSTGTGAVVLAISPTLVNPTLGTPIAGVLTNCSCLPLTSGVTGTLQAVNGGTGLSSLGTGVATFLGTPSSANLRAAVTDETGSGALVFATSPTLTTPVLGTPSSGTLTSCTGLPLTTGVTGTLPVANGGTGATTFTSGALLKGSGTGAITAANAANIVAQIGATPVQAANTATEALLIFTTPVGVSGTYNIPFVDSITSGVKDLYTDSATNLTYNPSTNLLTAGNLTANTCTFTTVTATTSTATTVALGSGWTATVSSGKLVFRVSGVTKASLDSSGNFIVTGNVTAYGTP